MDDLLERRKRMDSGGRDSMRSARSAAMLSSRRKLGQKGLQRRALPKRCRRLSS